MTHSSGWMARKKSVAPLLALVAATTGLAVAARTVAGSPRIALVATGADVLVAHNFSALEGRRVGVITNHTGVTATGARIIDLLAHAPKLTLAALFAPEHGLDGGADGRVASSFDPTAGVPVYSLYGQTLRPADPMIDGLEGLVFDIQDSGARFYTYVSTMAYAMEAAARRGIPFYVLDRPNPISAAILQGPIMDADLKSFTGYFPLPTRHGMTMGELAQMFNSENHIGAGLHIVAMQGYRRDQWYDDTGLAWVPPSPNLRTLAEATLYPGVGMIEGANVSVGRGTETPFEVLGAPWIDAGKLATYLEGRHITGVRFAAAHFTPSKDRYAARRCHGVRITLLDRQTLDAAALGVELIAGLHRLYPGTFTVDSTLGMLGSRRVLGQIKAGDDPRRIVASWQPQLEDFRRLRAKYLLY